MSKSLYSYGEMIFNINAIMHYLHDGFMFTENCLVENIMK